MMARSRDEYKRGRTAMLECFYVFLVEAGLRFSGYLSVGTFDGHLPKSADAPGDAFYSASAILNLQEQVTRTVQLKEPLTADASIQWHARLINDIMCGLMADSPSLAEADGSHLGLPRSLVARTRSALHRRVSVDDDVLGGRHRHLPDPECLGPARYHR